MIPLENVWCARQDSNLRPTAPEAVGRTCNLMMARVLSEVGNPARQRKGSAEVADRVTFVAFALLMGGAAAACSDAHAASPFAPTTDSTQVVESAKVSTGTAPTSPTLITPPVAAAAPAAPAPAPTAPAPAPTPAPAPVAPPAASKPAPAPAPAAPAPAQPAPVDGPCGATPCAPPVYGTCPAGTVPTMGPATGGAVVCAPPLKPTVCPAGQHPNTNVCVPN